MQNIWVAEESLFQIRRREKKRALSDLVEKVVAGENRDLSLLPSGNCQVSLFCAFPPAFSDLTEFKTVLRGEGERERVEFFK